MEAEIKNAVIAKATLGRCDHGGLDAWLHLDYGGGGQGFGGYALYLPPGFKHHSIESCAGHFIWRVLEIAGVETWEQLKGKTIRAKATWDKVEAIGHIVKDDWFNPSEDFKNL